MEWQPIETAPKDDYKMFVVQAFNIPLSEMQQNFYTSDPYCVFRENGIFIRWPHKFHPTHWMPLPDPPTD